MLEEIILKNITDKRGSLSVVENADLPFDIKRVFWITDANQSEARGAHAHYKTRHCLIPVQGSCTLKIDDNYDIRIDARHNRGYILEPEHWHTMYEFSNDCILMALASEEYNEHEYIRDFEEWKQVYNR